MDVLVRNWWIFAVRGALGVLFGLTAFFWPGLAWIAIVALFAVYALLDGSFAIVAAISGNASGRPRWALILEGVLGISAAALTIFWPGITELVLLALIAYWSIATGVFEIVAAIRLRKLIEGEWLLAFSGVLSVIFGCVLVFMPIAGLLAVAWLIGCYALIFGAALIALGFRLRSWGQVHAPAGGHAKPMSG